MLRRMAALLVSAGAFLSKAASARMLALAVVLTMALAMLLALTLASRCSVLLVWLMWSRSATATPSAPFPPGVTGRRIRSLIHVALLVTFVCPQVAGLPNS